MSGKTPDMVCFSSIKITDPVINGKNVKANIILKKTDGNESTFCIMLKYQEIIKEKYLPLLRLAFTIPLLNYGLFSKKFELDFPISKKDNDMLNELNIVFSKDIYVNKILRRRTNYILPSYIPKNESVKLRDAAPKAEIKPSSVYDDQTISSQFDKNSCGILSSGGKESLLTYGLLNEIGCRTYPLYVNESGGHWRTALPAYRNHKKIDEKTQRVWTNIDRFYVFMLDNLKFIRPDHRKIWADTYPIRLCIFPFYVFLLLPIFADKSIGNLLIGSEFDDLRETPEYLGIKHYFGIYDQHQDYDILMNNWYFKRMPGLVQWSAVRNISGLIVERILVKRFPELAKLQRSCHSCHFEKNEVVPCGICSKCMGVLLFLLANKTDPQMMKFKKEDIESFPKRVNSKNLRLDEDEKNQSFYIIGKKDNIPDVIPVDHVEKMHLYQNTCDISLIPINLRKNLLEIIKKYTTGFCKLENDNWVHINDSNIDF
ncbi:hypothetical protein AYK24_03125 [Thermoplasmatales archaeon SG8-52-4]|nr:MAG: hypothetical protein AYK24_03125 [Thermoplasmatales archaeon SG8-52-4]